MEYINLSLMESTGHGETVVYENTDYEIRSFSYSIRKDALLAVEIESLSKIGIIRVIMNTFPSGQLIRWAFDLKKQLNGLINVREGKNSIPHESILINKAHCTKLALYYKFGGNDEVQISLDIHPETVVVNGEEISNE